MTRPGLIGGLPGGPEPLMNEDDPRLDRLLTHTTLRWSEFAQMLPKRKLGLAFEAIVAWGMVHGLGWTLLERDLQVFEERRTIGALDLVVRDCVGQIVHWELAYKLYLQEGTETDWSAWLGPAGRDRLSLKLTHMIHHQVPLSTHPQATAALRAAGIPTPVRRRLLLQGTLFSRWDASPSRARSAVAPAEGRWLRHSEIPAYLDRFPGGEWVPRAKPLWIGPAPSESAGWCDSDLPRRARPQDSQLFSHRHNDSEVLVFIVPEQWGRYS